MSRLIVEQDVWMSTRDGVRLAADVYRPDDNAPHPVLLHRTPYGKSTASFVSAIVADPIECFFVDHIGALADSECAAVAAGTFRILIEQ